MKAIALVLGSLGVIQALLISIYLFSLKEKKSNRFLALILLALTVRIGKSVLNVYTDLDPWIRNLGISALLTIGPLMWFYSKALFEKKNLRVSDYLHLVPFALFVLCSRIIPNRADAMSLTAYSLVLSHMIIYLAFCWRYVFRFFKDSRLMPWYRDILAGLCLIWFVYLGVFIGFIPFYILTAVFFSILIYIFSYLLLKRHVFSLEKYASGIDHSTSRELLQRLKSLFEKEQIYLDSDVSLSIVAQGLSVTARDVSQVINENEQKNFSEFVNHYRIEKARTLLSNPIHQHEKIASIAYDCGFGNVTSFNVAFKSVTGMTPSQYRDKFQSLGN
jgi:AraC-like DNA-binding protein